jgi:hypothetical protein
LDPIIRSLNDRLPTDHFLLHYALRNSRNGSGFEKHGVRQSDILSRYAKSLENAYAAMRNEPWLRPHPIREGAERIWVYIYQTPIPYTYAFQSRLPVIVLPSRHEEPTAKSELQKLSAEAVHEVAHAFNFHEHPMITPQAREWHWFDEGFAIYFEECVLPNNHDRFRFLIHWMDTPEVSLDDRGAAYKNSMFVRYLANRFGKEFVNQVWTKSKQEETPLEAIARMLPDGLKFTAPGFYESDVFSDYCRDAYFLRDPDSHSRDTELWERFGDRGVHYSFELASGGREETESHLDHLACRYFRFWPKPGVAKLSVHLHTQPAFSHSPLKAELAFVTRDGRRLSSQLLTPLVVRHVGEPVRLFAETRLPADGEFEHLVLVVSNCGTRPEPANTRLPHDDGQQFKIEVSAE